jgi:hypothetical protein
MEKEKNINYRKLEDKQRLIEKLAQLYNSQYDIRLCQLISNLHGAGVQDIFFTYDDKLEKLIDEALIEDV